MNIKIALSAYHTHALPTILSIVPSAYCTACSHTLVLALSLYYTHANPPITALILHAAFYGLCAIKEDQNELKRPPFHLVPYMPGYSYDVTMRRSACNIFSFEAMLIEYAAVGKENDIFGH